MIGNGPIGASKRGAIALEKIENKLIIEQECVFSISKRFTIGASATVDIVIDQLISLLIRQVFRQTKSL
jgi:hypothetical protein